ncbi:hypothetical protein D0C36_22610 [Mucilaginibacter conchicola]|uniref:Uncharacterized protein n=1 Tax=Mucilaginibacter conchicola TaxID=2303333 RepID=A0A372NN30_9SPHI|nr:hypothetical protein [Mucilaginibacter conchicola]RFZ90040.1 hypothetical protein D0C36_22610 [Mucilaginibacter conchicola]
MKKLIFLLTLIFIIPAKIKAQSAGPQELHCTEQTFTLISASSGLLTFGAGKGWKPVPENFRHLQQAVNETRIPLSLTALVLRGTEDFPGRIDKPFTYNLLTSFKKQTPGAPHIFEITKQFQSTIQHFFVPLFQSK